MTPEGKLQRLQAILVGLFAEARAANQRDKLEKRGSELGKSPQVVHPFDRAIDVICRDLDLPNPGTDGHSLRVYPHPVDGWPPNVAEAMRRWRVRFGHEKCAPGPGKDEWLDEGWLRAEGYSISKRGWARKGSVEEEYAPKQETSK